MSTATYRDVSARYFREHWQPLRNASQMLARLTAASPRTAENWLSGTAAPSGEALLTLMAMDEEFASQILQLIEDRRCASR